MQKSLFLAKLIQLKRGKSNIRDKSSTPNGIGRKQENGSRRTEAGERKQENGSRRTEAGERKQENGSRRTEAALNSENRK